MEEIDHGRIETRKCTVISDFQFIRDDNRKNLKSVVKVESIREFKNSDKIAERAVRYFISSVRETPEIFQNAIRSHWGIENKLHWVLDVPFGEDASRKRKDHAPQNFSTLNKIALNLLKNEKSLKIGVKSKWMKAGWNDKYLLKVLSLMKS